MLVEVGALISWCIHSYRIVMLLVPYMWASMTLLPMVMQLQFADLSMNHNNKMKKDIHHQFCGHGGKSWIAGGALMVAFNPQTKPEILILSAFLPYITPLLLF